MASASQVVIELNSAALDAIRDEKTAPPVASRALAILHAAIYDAVNGIRRTHEYYFVPSAAPAAASIEAAASAAGHDVLVALFPKRAASFDTLEADLLSQVTDGPRQQMGVAWGRHVAAQILAARAADGWDATLPPPSASGVGSWVPTPPGYAPYLLPQWGLVAPFCMADISQVRPPGPPPLTSARYAADYNEIKALGAALGSSRTPDQTQIALFWADGAGTKTPPGHWNSIARQISVDFGNTLEEQARLFALLNLALADAAICAWDAKYFFDFWRPVTAIRNGDQDGNAETEPDLAWSSLLITPPFPDYVSGHSTFSGAASTILAQFYGTDQVPFTIGSDFLPGVFRSFDSFSAAAEEAAVSRLYGGIHFRSANEDGLNAGVEIGQWTFTHFLQAKDNRARSRNRPK